MERERHRYAFEWYMKAEDKRYWKMVNRELKKITVLAVTGTVIGSIAMLHIFLAKKRGG